MNSTSINTQPEPVKPKQSILQRIRLRRRNTEESVDLSMDSGFDEGPCPNLSRDEADDCLALMEKGLFGVKEAARQEAPKRKGTSDTVDTDADSFLWSADQ